MTRSTLLAVAVWLLAETSVYAQSALRTLKAYSITTVTFIPYCVDMAWQKPLGGRVSWLTASVANPEPLPTDARVFLLRGSGTVFSPGFGEICTRLRSAGIWTEDLGPAGNSWVCRHVIAERSAGRLQGPIILIGHSRGARQVVEMARQLEEAGIAVDLLICLDASMLPNLPGNVRQALNVYMSQPRLYPADTLKPAPGATARVENLDLRGPDAPELGFGLCHINIAAYRAVQDLICARVQQAARATPGP